MFNKLYNREPMSTDERKMLAANRKLVEKKIELEKDIRVLISYLKGRKYLKDEVRDIIAYYSKIKENTDDN